MPEKHLKATRTARRRFEAVKKEGAKNMSILAIVHEIEKIRILRGISIKALAEQAGIGIWTYYHWLEGKSCPNVRVLSLVMDVLQIEIKLLPRGLEI
jgi:DNA-binding phage protein